MSAGKLPEEWGYTEIGNVADVISGGTPKSGVAENFAPSGEGIAWLTPADLSGYKNKHISRGARDLSKSGYDSCSAKIMPMGSILFSSRAPIGYVAVASNAIATNQGFKSFVFTPDIYPDYAYYYMRSIKHLAEEMGTGTTFKEISGSSAKNLPFLIAPFEEQKIIAEKLDTLLAQVDSTKTRLEKIPKILKRFRQAVLASASRGILTEDFVNLDLEYYSSIDDEIQAHPKLKKIPYPIGDEISFTEDIFGLDIGRKRKLYALEQLVEAERGVPYGIVQTGEPVSHGVQTIRCGDIKPLSVTLSSLKTVSHDIEKKYKKTRLKGGEVILAIRGSVGNSAYIDKKIGSMSLNISREVAMIPVRESISAKFISLLIQSPCGYRFLVEKTRGVAQQGINLADIRRLVVPLPTQQEQHEIVRRVEQLFAYADTIEKQVNTSLARVNNLTQSILAKAFRGELTTQWREENPDLISGENSAAVLLEKIKAERAASAGKKASRKKA
ncbi:restriction endonuclease subunit S [Pectobacterium versatile]|uniref:restriction endonuclease subunit S n=1 Tax=Pectobacterium versatile TaxID=2488639 RepID=UPI0015DFA869|nr:restriction endonuclease subunit S [Pectobacterium versatile]MBA0170885.1 restriction endonuclease subunit S [Pectobacterium versatile]MCA6917094.1 restriction endonuclease subunit S [Pectobacterium versatile]